MVISHPHKQLWAIDECNYLIISNVSHDNSDKTIEIPLPDTSLLKEFERTKPCCMHMGTNNSTNKNAKSSNKCFRPQGIWENKTISSAHENWYWATQTLEAKQLSNFPQHNYFSIIKIKTSDWFPDFIFLVPVKRNRRSSGQSERVCVFIKINFARIQFNKNTSII